MAERQQVFRWVRDILAAGVVALTVTTLTVSQIVDVDTITGANTGGTGSCELDMCSATADEVKLLVDDAELCAAAGGGTVACGPLDGCLRFGAHYVCASATGAVMSADTGGQVSTDAGGVNVLATAAGADIVLNANDQISIGPNGGGVLSLVGSSGGWSMTAVDAGQSIQATAEQAIALTSTADAVSLAGFTSVSGGVAGGGSFSVDAAGATLAATQAGDDIVVTTVGGGDQITVQADGSTTVSGGAGESSLLLNAAGIVVATSGADTLTLNTAGLQATIEQGGLAYHLGGQQLGVFSTFTPTGTGSYELAWQWSLPAGALATAGHGWSLDWSFQVAQNTNEKLVKITAGSPTCTCASPTIATPLNSTSASCASGTSRVELVAYTAALQRIRHSTMCQVASASMQAIVGDVESGLNAGLTPANAYQFCLCAQATTTNTDTNLVVGVLNWL